MLPRQGCGRLGQLWTAAGAGASADHAGEVLLVLSRCQALAAGHSPAEIDALVRSRRWLALRRAVYLLQPCLPDDPVVRHAVLVQAAALSTAVPVVASHRSAALLHGLPLVTAHSGEPVLTRVVERGAPRGPGRRSARLVAVVPEDQQVLVHGAPVTSVARSALDLARTVDDLDAVLVLDRALALVPLQALVAVLDSQRGWPGSTRARRRLSFADGRAESALESLGRLRMAEQGLPAPQLQVTVGDAGGPVARVDYAWLEHRTVAEADGRLKYSGARDLWEEKRREDRLRDIGFEVVRFTWDDAFRHPAELAARVRRAFARADVRRAA